MHSKMLGATKIEGPEWGGMGTGIGLNFVLRFKSLGMGKKKCQNWEWDKYFGVLTSRDITSVFPGVVFKHLVSVKF